MCLIVRLGFDCLGKHALELDLKRHCVGAALVGHEELAVTMKRTIIKSYMVIIIIAMKRNIKLVEEESILLFGIAFRLFSFQNWSSLNR